MSESSVTEKPVSHTPAPWRVEPDEFNGPREQAISIMDGEDTFIAAAWADFEAEADEERTGGMAPHGTALANARLIAAAPELLNALRETWRVLDAAGLSNLSNGVQLGPTVWYVKAEDARAISLAAIAKAEGGAQ